MRLSRLRQQGGALVMTIPADLASVMGWSAGAQVEVRQSGCGITAQPVKRQPRGRKTIAELLEGINPEDMSACNEELKDWLASGPVGKEIC